MAWSWSRSLEAHTPRVSLTMSGPMRAIHSLAAPPGPTPARPPLRRGAAAASPLGRSTDPQPSPPTPPSLASRRAVLLALVLAAAPARPAAAAFSLGIRTTASLPSPASSLRIAVAGPLTIFPSSCPVGPVQLGPRSCCGSRRRSRRPSSSRPSPPPATPSSKLKLSSVIPVSRVTIVLPDLFRYVGKILSNCCVCAMQLPQLRLPRTPRR